MNNNQQAFFALVRAGLWGDLRPVPGFRFQDPCDVDWDQVLQMAMEQSVAGLAASGVEAVQAWLKDHGYPLIPRVVVVQFAGAAQYIEQQNKDLNAFVAGLYRRLRSVGVSSLLVKGQGAAQCYERPLWRTSGDVDLLLAPSDYEKAKKELFPVANEIQTEDTGALHQAMMIMGFDVELHGKMRFSLSKKANQVTEEVIRDALKMKDNDPGEGACVWKNGDTDVYLPNPDNHVFLLFMHFLNHFFIEGVGLRQICDWCRMLYTYRDSLNCGLLESRIRQAGLMSEWKAFYNLASRYLGMPDYGSGLMVHDSRFDKKADRIMELVLESGNFGQNKDLSYRSKYTGFRYYMVSLWRRIGDFAGFVPLFPADALRFFVTYALGKVIGDNRRVDNKQRNI